MKKLFAVVAVMSLFAMPTPSHAADLSYTLRGRIALQVESNGEAWYINPVNRQRYFLGRAEDGYNLMRDLGLGIKHATLTRYLQYRFPSTLSGRIMLDVENHGEAYYVNPLDLKGIYLKDGAAAYDLMRNKGLGITNNNLAYIPVAYKYLTTEQDYFTAEIPTHWIDSTDEIWNTNVDLSNYLGTPFNQFEDPSLKAMIDVHMTYMYNVATERDSWSNEVKRQHPGAVITWPLPWASNNGYGVTGFRADYTGVNRDLRTLFLVLIYDQDDNARVIVADLPRIHAARMQPAIVNMMKTLVMTEPSLSSTTLPSLSTILGTTTDPSLGLPEPVIVNVADKVNPVTIKNYANDAFAFNYQTNWGVIDMSAMMQDLTKQLTETSSAPLTDADIAALATDLGIDASLLKPIITDLSRQSITHAILAMDDTGADPNMGIVYRMTDTQAYDFSNPTYLALLQLAPVDQIVKLVDQMRMIDGKSTREVVLADPNDTANHQISLLFTAADPQTGYVTVVVTSAADARSTWQNVFVNSIDFIK